MNTITAAGFAHQHFGTAELGDKRRTKRLVKMATAFASGGTSSCGGTISSVIRDKHQAKAAYRLLDCEKVTHEAVIAPQAAFVREQMSQPGVYLVIEDTTLINFQGLKQTLGLGPIGESYTRGLLAHQALVVRAELDTWRLEVVGLLGQRVWARPPVPPPTDSDAGPGAGECKKKGKGKQKKDAELKPRADRESSRWMASMLASGAPAEGSTWIYVADREADIYELYQQADNGGYSCVIRAAQPRALVTPEGDLNLLSAAESAPVKGRMLVPLSSTQKEMEVELASTTVTLRGVNRPGGRLANHTVNVVHARQVDAAGDEPPACWTLVTDLPVDTLEECSRVVGIYRTRWLVEELHKALKTGLKVEASQLSDARRLSALIGILSVVATFLIHQKLAARNDPDALLSEADADPDMLALLSTCYPPPDEGMTNKWFWITIARLGGYHPSPRPQPGWLTLWRGWQALMLMLRGYAHGKSG